MVDQSSSTIPANKQGLKTGLNCLKFTYWLHPAQTGDVHFPAEGHAVYCTKKQNTLSSVQYTQKICATQLHVSIIADRAH